MKKLNNRGLAMVPTIILGIALVNVVYCMMPSNRETFQAKKAKVLCAEGYKGVSCAEIDQMNKDEILAYIRDDIEVAQTVMRERLGG